MSTLTISAADVNKLRQQTGAGLMDCKKALTEANGDFEQAIDYLRKKGQKVAANRSDREAKEGYVIGKLNADHAKGYVIALNSETDFVAKNQEFIQFAEDVLTLAMQHDCNTVEDVKALNMGSITVNDKLFDMIGKIGEKLEISAYERVTAARVVVYNHPGNKLTSIIGVNKNDISNIDDVARNVAMQTAAMSPVAIDKSDVDTKMLERELEIARDVARNEGKPEEMIEKIAQGKLNKFYSESTLLNQAFIKEDKMSVRQYLTSIDKDLTVTAMKRIQIG